MGSGISVLVVVGLALAGCGSSSEEPPGSGDDLSDLADSMADGTLTDTNGADSVANPDSGAETALTQCAYRYGFADLDECYDQPWYIRVDACHRNDLWCRWWSAHCEPYGTCGSEPGELDWAADCHSSNVVKCECWCYQ